MNSKYTEEQKAFIKANGKGLDDAALAAVFNSYFSTRVPVRSIKSIRYRLGATSGLTPRPDNAGRFKKGGVPSNKGVKRSDYMSEEAQNRCAKTQFKKGHPSLNRREVGSERITKDGYIEIKVAEPNRWKLKHRWVWETEYGKAPKGHKIIMLDGDKTNTELSNLKLVTNAEEGLLNHFNLRHTDKDLTEMGVQIVKVMQARRSAARKLEKPNSVNK